MAERPILFKGEMVRAILEGKKTETRRIVKPGNTEGPYNRKNLDILWNEGKVGDPGSIWLPMKHPSDSWDDFDEGAAEAQFFSRIKSGDLLWVKETWAKNPSCYDGDPEFVYKASFPTGSVDNTHDTLEPHGTWKPSIHIPRRASRITLKVVSVHAERLQDITDEGAIAEGIDPEEVHVWNMFNDPDEPVWTNRSAYADLWERINGEGSWALNPWVWVIRFERIDQQNHQGKINNGGTE